MLKIDLAVGAVIAIVTGAMLVQGCGPEREAGAVLAGKPTTAAKEKATKQPPQATLSQTEEAEILGTYSGQDSEGKPCLVEVTTKNVGNALTGPEHRYYFTIHAQTHAQPSSEYIRYSVKVEEFNKQVLSSESPLQYKLESTRSEQREYNDWGANTSFAEIKLNPQHRLQSIEVDAFKEDFTIIEEGNWLGIGDKTNYWKISKRLDCKVSAK